MLQFKLSHKIHKQPSKIQAMFVHNISPIIFSLGPLEVRWYGLLYAIGWLLGYVLIGQLVKKRRLMTIEHFQNYFIYGLIATVIGARIGSILSELPYYMQNPGEIIAIWHGGVSFHGGLVGVLLFSWWYFRRHKVSFLAMADVVAPVAALTLGIGRLGNFINSEFYGTPTNLPWGVVFPGIAGARHPTQIYESLFMLALAAFLWWRVGKSTKKGETFAAFIIIYAVGRFIIEMLKDPVGVTHIGPLTWGQFWNVPMILAGLFLLYRIRASLSSPHRVKSHK